MKAKLWNYLFSAITVAVVCAFPAAFLYFQNAAEAGFSEAAPFLFGSVAVGLVIFAALAALTRKPGKSAIIVSLFMMAVLNFSYLENAMKLALPDLKYWHTVPIVLVVMLHVMYAIWHFTKENTAGDVSKIVCLVFGGLIIFNSAIAAPKIVGHYKTQRILAEKKEQEAQQPGQSNTDMPNVYLLIFDEYANFTEMEECYDYDNAPLKDFLVEHNFNISYTSHNESAVSRTVQTNMANLDYIVADSTDAGERDVLRHNGVLFQVMRDHGYNIRILEDGNFYGGSMPDESSVVSKATTVNGEDIEILLWRMTILYPLFQKNDIHIIQDYEAIADYIGDTAADVQNTFTLAYFCFPHPPFVVDEYGNELGLDAYAGPNAWGNKAYYLGQFKYATKIMLSILGEVIENDPKAVVVLMSDHGARETPGVTLEMKINSLNALYYQGEKCSIEGLSNVNTLRTVLNELFSLNYEMVEVPKLG